MVKKKKGTETTIFEFYNIEVIMNKVLVNWTNINKVNLLLKNDSNEYKQMLTSLYKFIGIQGKFV